MLHVRGQMLNYIVSGVLGVFVEPKELSNKSVDSVISWVFYEVAYKTN